jgi:hypothetical protein
MKRITLFLATFLLLCAWVINFSGRPSTKDSINPLLGNTSFVKKYGYEPGKTTNEQDRIKTHLLYAASVIRGKSTDGMPAEMVEKRKHLLHLLDEYAMAGKFPANYDYTDERKPCFIDRDHNICAVGYLVEQTAGRDAAIAINKKHQYETISEMKDDPLLKGWVAQSGLTLEECAMIQPTYGNPNPNPDPAPSDQYISRNYGVTTGISAGLNIGFNAINQFQIKNGSKSKLVPVLGLATGAYSIINGITHYPRKPVTTGFYTEEANETKKLLSVGNIALGSVSMILSTWNLLKNRKPIPKKITWNLYSQPVYAGRTAYGFSFTKKIG